MASLLRLGQLLKGRIGIYVIRKQVHESVWLAKYAFPPAPENTDHGLATALTFDLPETSRVKP